MFVPRILTTYMNKTFLCTERWEQLIIKYMPDLYIFDFMYFVSKYVLPYDCVIWYQLLNKFKSSFWKIQH
ncbi:unnamed protein product [Rotaria sp. Silwood2]|nr:unnamed protein product [Rotaria sp. Silwood2]CAF3143587.1 unnamed protein product [Rotaria sp. Silwood2]CAF3390942.1 unnamed protein product [Rotaria sp. Silwood2]CAF3486462.1 unnamed protein product [Rotaria sp. Silwood2]CAF4340645.1 unnamed protein product [Rotaria sp. Silwood2]